MYDNRGPLAPYANMERRAVALMFRLRKVGGNDPTLEETDDATVSPPIDLLGPILSKANPVL